MAIQAYDLLKPISDQVLPALDGILSKGQADAQERGIDERVFLDARLAPDMFPFVRQVQIVTDFLKGGFSRLAGLEVPSWKDDEATFAALKARVQKTIDHAGTFSRERFDDAAERDIELKFPGVTLNFKGNDYLIGFLIPNVYFHQTAAYAILRHNGVALGKQDFMGN